MANVDTVLQHIGKDTLDGTDELFQIYPTCYRVLKAHGDARTTSVLDEANKLLSTRACFLAREEDREAFFHNVPSHRELMTLWEDNG